jgi:hypothetical protein
MQGKEPFSGYGKHLQQDISLTKSTRYQYIRYVQSFLIESFKEAAQS